MKTEKTAAITLATTKMVALMVSTFGGIVLTGCSLRGDHSGQESKVMAMEFSSNQKLALHSTANLAAWLREGGFLGDGAAQPGTKVYYSTSYKTDGKEGGAEAGQALGVLENDNGRINFRQTDNVTTQLLLCPGASGGWGAEGSCLWRFDGPTGFIQLAYDVMLNPQSTDLYAGYESMTVTQGKMSGGTAGRQVSYGDVVEVSLTGPRDSVDFYLAKGIGLVTFEYRGMESPGSPDGTAKGYFDVPGAH